MTKFKVGLRYELQKLLKHIVLFIVGAVAFLVVIQLMFLPLTGLEGFGSISYSGSYAFTFLFLVFWTAIAFGKDTGLFLQSGFTRREMFLIFVAAVVVEALVFALLDAIMSLAVPDYWRSQSFFLNMAGTYSAALFFQVTLLNLAVASCTLVVTALQRRVGTGWTVACLIALYVFMAVGLPALFSLIPGGIEAYGTFLAGLMWSPFAPSLPFVFYFAVAVVTLALTWLLLRRANADRFAAGK